MLPLIFGILVCSFASFTYAGNINLGGPCSVANDRLDGDSLHSLSDCDARTYCLNATCVPRGCRRDEYPFAWRNHDPDLPPLCGPGSFCPDEGSGCKAQKTVGESCQMNRDEQCGSTPESRLFSSLQNANGSICLAFICTYANAGVGQACTIDQVSYTDAATNSSFIMRRDNCQNPALYCESAGMTCQLMKPYGVSCFSNRECATQFCQLGVCVDPPETPMKIQTWQYVVTIITMLGALTAACVLLSLVHRRHQLRHQQTISEYYYQQSDLRRSMVALQLAASRKRLN